MTKARLDYQLREITRLGSDTQTQSLLLIAEVLFDIKEELVKQGKSINVEKVGIPAETPDPEPLKKSE